MHEHTESLTRLLMAVIFAGLGVAALARPRWFAGVAGFFTCSPGLSASERERLDRVVVARERAEGISRAYGRYLAVVAFLCAPLEAIWTIPFILPYALFCFASAVVMLLAYLQYRRATEQRVAPLVPRSLFTALPPIVVGAMGCSLVASLALVADSTARLGGLAVATCTLVLGIIAWRVAVAPALLIGADPQWEYAVDERVRIGRARTIANLACTPAFVLLAMLDPSSPSQYAHFGSAIFYLAAVAFFVTLVAAIAPLRQRIRPA